MHSGEAAAGQMNNMRSLHVCTHFNGEHVIRDLFLSLMKRQHAFAHVGNSVSHSLWTYEWRLCVCCGAFFSMTMPSSQLWRIRPISSPRLLNIHPRSSTRPDNKQEARGLNAWVGRGGGQRGRRKGGGGGGQIPTKVGGKQPVSKVTSPASVLCSSLWEKGEGRQEGFFLFSSFSFFSFFSGRF